MATLAELAEKTKVTDELWMTTHRPDGSTASFPLWFIHDGERLYFLSAESSTEVWDLKSNPKVDWLLRSSRITSTQSIASTIGPKTSPDGSLELRIGHRLLES